MTKGILAGLSIVEGSAFVAAPLGGMTLAQLGADVIRYDQIGGGVDYRRWPVTGENKSLFWAGMNKGKRSIQIDFRSPQGKEILTGLITRKGPDQGVFLTNFPPTGALSYANLKKRREDLIMVVLSGNHDGTSAVDYTVNASVGFPSITGDPATTAPVNSVLPAWDIAMGNLAAVGILAAERLRRRQGVGTLVNLALSDVALASTAHLGRLGQAQLNQVTRKDGNFLYGAFGHDFITADGRRVMVVGLTERQWSALISATGFDALLMSSKLGVDLSSEGGRFNAREAIRTELDGWFAARSLKTIQKLFESAGVLWSVYQDFEQLLAEDPRASTENPMFTMVDQPGIGQLLTPSSPLKFSSVETIPGLPAPKLGEHTDEILTELGLSDLEIARLHDAGVVAGSTKML